MRIIKSKERDYYDFAGYWASDVLYVRKTEPVNYNINKETRLRMQNLGEDTTYYPHIYRYYILICGNI